MRAFLKALIRNNFERGKKKKLFKGFFWMYLHFQALLCYLPKMKQLLFCCLTLRSTLSSTETNSRSWACQKLSEIKIIWLLKSWPFFVLIPFQTPRACFSSSIYFLHPCSLFLLNSCAVLCSVSQHFQDSPFLIPSIVTALSILLVLLFTESCQSSYAFRPCVVCVFWEHILLSERQKTSTPTFAFLLLTEKGC